MAEIKVEENPAGQRFEITVDGELAGFLTYDIQGTDYALNHTKIDQDREGQGLGTILIRSTLETLRDQGSGVRPNCPFVRAFLQKHPEYVDVVPAACRSAFGLPSA